MKRPKLSIKRDRDKQNRWWTLRDVREDRGISQSELGSALGITQAAVLKTENATDPRHATVRRYLAGLARSEGKRFDLHMVATIGEDVYRIRLPDPDSLDADDRHNHPNDPEGDAMLNVNPTTPPARTAGTTWRLRAWDDPDLEVAWHTRGIITISDDEVGDLTDWPGQEDLASRLAEALPDRTPQATGMFVTYWRYFRIEMAPGDLVLVPQSRKRVGIARITDDYFYDAHEPNTKLRHQRGVDWLRTIPRSELDEDIRRVVNAPGTICQVRAPGAAARLA